MPLTVTFEPVLFKRMCRNIIWNNIHLESGSSFVPANHCICNQSILVQLARSHAVSPVKVHLIGRTIIHLTWNVYRRTAHSLFYIRKWKSHMWGYSVYRSILIRAVFWLTTRYVHSRKRTLANSQTGMCAHTHAHTLTHTRAHPHTDMHTQARTHIT